MNIILLKISNIHMYSIIFKLLVKMNLLDTLNSVVYLLMGLLDQF